MKNEGDVKKAIKAKLTAAGCWWYMPVQTGYGVKGIPDFVCCFRGRFVGIEAKFGNNKESAWQVKQGAAIVEAGGTYVVINDRNLDELDELLALEGAYAGP